MNDLSGLSWDAAPLPTNGAKRNSTQSPFLNSAPSPLYLRQSTPLSAQSSGRTASNSTSNTTSKPTHDSFASLLASNATKKTSTLSLQERQKQLLEAKLRQNAPQQTVFSTDDASFLETLGSGRSTPAASSAFAAPPVASYKSSAQDSSPPDDDLLAAFNSAAPVDSSSHFPPPNLRKDGLGQQKSRDSSLGPQRIQSPAQSTLPVTGSQLTFDDDDDPFGLGEISKKASGQYSKPRELSQQDDDDDILGMLGRPVAKHTPQHKAQIEPVLDSSSSSDSEDLKTNRAGIDAEIAELVDMGFPLEKSRIALEQTGGSVQAAVGWLLNKAHEESKSRSHTPAGFESDGDRRGRQSKTTRQEPLERSGGSTPAWMRVQAGQQRQDSRSPAISEGDITQYATEIGSSLYKSANSLWKTSQKKVQKAMSDYSDGDRDGSQPKWMRSVKNEPQSFEREEVPRPQARPQNNLTDEAMLLEARPEPPARPSNRRDRNDGLTEVLTPAPPRWRTPPVAEETSSRSQPPPLRHNPPAQSSQQSFVRPNELARPSDRLRKQVLEEESAQAYISPARRKKTQLAPVPPPSSEPSKPTETQPELDIFSDNSAIPTPRPVPASGRTSTPTPRTSTPLAVRPKAPSRPVPPVSAGAMANSATHRLAGTEAFKRGDYATAQSSYTNAISALPPTHPILIILYSNRALTFIKTGDPRAAISDADAAINAIGPSRGDGESISLGDSSTETEKPMKEFYGKALTRKAEALEHLEKWADAAAVWRDAIAAGIGGSVSIQGRNRCEKAAGITPSATAAAPISRPASAPVLAARRPAASSAPVSRKPTTPAFAQLSVNGDADSEAVKRLRAANAAANAASDEAFSLHDTVSLRLNAWKAGKEGNLRALLASLDTVLWAEAGWNKVGMGDLVLPPRVKIVYMKAIAKVHPDKLAQTATTEHKMISAAVFATLNEAWDRFKRDNGL